ncbi:MAG: hypothetical protein HUK17_07335 [Bacteroidales bacterium]|nr:hypothetical protein [Bacteroidales bacterium]
MKRIILLLLLLPVISHAQSSYIIEQLGRNEHQIVQSLGAFVGNERAESQMFDITFTPSGNNVEGRMIINTADYRCTFRMSTHRESVCFKIELICRTADFLREFQRLFQVYPTTGTETTRHLTFGNQTLLIEEAPSTRALPRTYTITIEN